MLKRFATRGWLTVDDGPAERRHGQWIDLWRAQCDTPYLVVLDSDVMCMQHGWLERLIDATDGVGLAAYGHCEPRHYVEQRNTGMQGVDQLVLGRPDPCVFVLDQARTAHVEVSFAWQPAGDVDARPFLAHDTAGAFAARLVEEGIGWRTIPTEHRADFRHFGGRSYNSPRLGRHEARIRLVVLANLVRLRLSPAA